MQSGVAERGVSVQAVQESVEFRLVLGGVRQVGTIGMVLASAHAKGALLDPQPPLA